MTEEEYRLANPKTLRIYDNAIDDFRDVTQKDVDILCRVASNWGGIRMAINNLHETAENAHKAILHELN